MSVLLQCLIVLVFAPLLTCVLELPIIKVFKVTDNCLYIVAVNVMTNLILNVASMILGLASPEARLIWIIVSEAVLIPVSEAELYKMISEAGRKRIYIATYVANAVSFSIGLIITTILGI